MKDIQHNPDYVDSVFALLLMNRAGVGYCPCLTDKKTFARPFDGCSLSNAKTYGLI